jgi:hypothetical protein
MAGRTRTQITHLVVRRLRANQSFRSVAIGSPGGIFVSFYRPVHVLVDSS